MRFENSCSKKVAKRNIGSLLGLVLMLLSLLAAGCTPPDDPMLDMLETDLKKTKVDDLARAMDFVYSEVRFEQKEFEDNLSDGLNRWITYSDEKLERAKWAEDQVSAPLLKDNSSLPMLQRNGEYNFLTTDGYYLQESAWLNQIVGRVTESTHLNSFELYRLAADQYKPDEEVENPVQEVIKKLHPDLEDEQAALNEKAGSDSVRGIRGTGYQRYPWQILLYGRADYVERAKLFMIALHQLNIESVMLQSKAEGSSPWAVGVAIGDQLFLFDTKMALPFPGEKIGTIATLTDVRANPKLLTGLNLSNEESLENKTEYWMTPDEVKDLDGLLYVTPESISKRMFALEKSLIGEQRLPLAFSGDDIKARLPEVDGVEIKAWDIAFKTHEFRKAIRESLALKGNSVIEQKLRWHFQDEAYVDNFRVYRTARARFFKGKFESKETISSRNAIDSWTRLMYEDADIDALGSDKKLQSLLGIRQEAGQSAQAFLIQVQSVQDQMKLIRRDAGFFLTQCLFDNRSENASRNWLNVLRSEQDAERWTDGVTYLLGRSLESCKEYDESIKVLSDSKSSQAHGNIVRTRMLKELISRL